MTPLFSAPASLLPQAGHPPSGTGLEWMVLASLLLPALLLLALVYLGSKRTV